MKNVLMIVLVILSLSFSTSAYAYHVQKGDTLNTIASTHGLSLTTLRSYNPQITHPDRLMVNQFVHTVPPLSKDDKQLLARLVRAEAEGEPFAGKVAVATVVLNRLEHPEFPDTVHGVIYETYKNGQIYAFSPVENGEISKAPDSDSVRAVEEAIRYEPYSKGSLFFYNPATSTSEWITKRQTVVTIGHHRFAK